MTSLVLDASALITMLREERGGDKVAHALGGARMCVVNLAEVTGHFVRHGMPPEHAEAIRLRAPRPFLKITRRCRRAAGASGKLRLCRCPAVPIRPQ